MCTKDIQTIVYPDGQEREEATVTRCNKAPSGYECAQPRVFTYPKVYSSAFPPTPRLTPNASPRPTTPRGYASASDRESDRSAGSGGSAARRSRRDRYTTYHSTSGPSGANVININRGGLGRQERILIVENPPTPRTPPQTFAMPFTAPSSPRSGFNMAADHYARPGGRSSHRDSLRPVIVDERPNRHVRFDDGEPSSSAPYLAAGHRRTGSGESRNSFGISSDDERRSSRRSPRQGSDFVLFPEQDDRSDRRRRRDEERAAAPASSSRRATADEQVDRDLRKAARIAQMNSHIDSRSAVPVPGLNRTTTDVAAEQRDRDLREAVRNLNIGPSPLRRRETGMTREEEAQKRRLEERLMPRRRATVGPGSRRGRAVYENGVYVWE